MRSIRTTVLFLLVLAPVLLAQAPPVVPPSATGAASTLATVPGNPTPETPIVSELDALKLASAAKDLQIAMLQTEKAQGQFQALWRSLQKPGWVLDVETMTYKKAPEAAPPTTPAAPKPGGGGSSQ